MMNVEISHREITTPGLYIMRWQGRTGLVRIVGQPSTGYKIIDPEKPMETYMTDLPKDGAIPLDAYFSEALAIQVV